MKVELFFVGKTTDKYLIEGLKIYLKRLQHYIQVSEVIISPASGTDQNKVLKEEGDNMLSKIKARDLVILLDDKGTMLSSEELAAKMQKWMVEGHSKLIFISGGAYGLSDSLRKRANFILSASRFTFTHQMIRLILAEQLYRAMTIIRNESYHHG
ncbi:MAG TPA: 23S rRNA (pseudouridine(1915)-N(3))-methyltransferase RlmH [Bacteroidia bacterium]|nr:23S rRNA (pseudouridine(1915)-N(3))-methyltransferase RlmH [Bacteroidia bacterium]HNS11739.1 23S rRNA (pseudouridine(1915)-N(3))-methyltransferase RlmH [Bacteroidia bacterium]